MFKLRYWFIILTAWLVFLFNIERLIKPVDITKYTYVLVALLALVILLIPASRRVPTWILLGGPSVVLLLLQILGNDPILGAEFPVTITEISSVILTGLLARQMARCLLEFEDGVLGIAIDYAGTKTDMLEDKQGVMYNEFKRARQYNRPLSLLVLKIDPHSIKSQLPEMLRLYQEGVLTQMTLAKIAKALDQNLFDTDIIARDHDSFAILLPELNSDTRDIVIKKVKAAIELDVDFGLGVATFPEDAVTFERLLEVAKSRLNNNAVETHPVSSSQPSAHLASTQ